MDKQLIAARFAKAAATYNNEAQVQQTIARVMADMLRRHMPTPNPSILEIGCGTGIYSRILLQSLQPSRMLLNDLCAAMQPQLTDILNQNVRFICGDAETTPFASGWQLVTSCSALQWFNNLPAFLHKCHNLLTPGGYLAFSSFGPENLREIAQLTGQTLNYPCLATLKTYLPRGLELIAAKEECRRLSIATPLKALYHLKRTGVTGISQQRWTKSGLRHFCKNYQNNFACNGGVTLTYNPLYIVARKSSAPAL